MGQSLTLCFYVYWLQYLFDENIIKKMENNHLFTEISPEEAAATSGGGVIAASSYLTVINYLFPQMARSPEVINIALLLLIGALSIPEIDSLELGENRITRLIYTDK